MQLYLFGVFIFSALYDTDNEAKNNDELDMDTSHEIPPIIENIKTEIKTEEIKKEAMEENYDQISLPKCEKCEKTFKTPTGLKIHMIACSFSLSTEKLKIKSEKVDLTTDSNEGAFNTEEEVVNYEKPIGDDPCTLSLNTEKEYGDLENDEDKIMIQSERDVMTNDSNEVTDTSNSYAEAVNYEKSMNDSCNTFSHSTDKENGDFDDDKPKIKIEEDTNDSNEKVSKSPKKCRKVYGMEHRDLWCKQCQSKRACARFGKPSSELNTDEEAINYEIPKDDPYKFSLNTEIKSGYLDVKIKKEEDIMSNHSDEVPKEAVVNYEKPKDDPEIMDFINEVEMKTKEKFKKSSAHHDSNTAMNLEFENKEGIKTTKDEEVVARPELVSKPAPPVLPGLTLLPPTFANEEPINTQ